MTLVWSGSRNHYIRQTHCDTFEISWEVDFMYSGSRLRWSRCYHRFTDLRGAKRFAKKWGVEERLMLTMQWFEEKHPRGKA